ncbi:MAG: L-fuculose-phosphate aldolase [Hyphomicrobiaceae bacterium]|jgi:L-fuculose-phosphate aldolase
MAKVATKSARVATKTPVGATTKRARSVAETAARKAVIVTALEMSRSGLSPGRSGNVSQRFGDGMLITPSGMAYDTLKPSDIVYVEADGAVAKGARKPSSEWRFHLSAYHARPDGYAIVHTHSLHATVIACTGRPIPAFHYMVAIAGGRDIPCVPYSTFGTEELAAYVADGLTERDACLMANHGQITIASCLTGALELAHEIEVLAEQYAKLLAIMPKPPVLADDEMDDVLRRFKGYGQKAQG